MGGGGGSGLTRQNDIGTTGDKIAKVIALFPFLISRRGRGGARNGVGMVSNTRKKTFVNELSLNCLS